jgi:hypothetical protein
MVMLAFTSLMPTMFALVSLSCLPNIGMNIRLFRTPVFTAVSIVDLLNKLKAETKLNVFGVIAKFGRQR